MKVSVIIPTYNGVNKVVNLLDSLINQQGVEFETIVVIDGSNDNTFDVIQHYKNKLKDFKIINQANGGRSVSRNNGAKLASGDLLIFFDDDMRLETNTILEHLNHHLNNQNSACVGTTWEDYEKSKTDVQKYRAYCSRKWCEGYKLNNGLIDKNKPYLTAANFSISKSLFFEYGGFDENLTDSEDYDLGVRLSLGNVDTYYKHAIIGWHDDYITLSSYINRLRQYEQAQNKLIKLKPELYQNRFTDYNYNQAKGLKKTIYSLFASKLFIWIINMDILKNLVPKSFRYKLYDIVITSFAVHFKNRAI